MQRLCLVLWVLGYSAVAWAEAEIRYVSDQLAITLRKEKAADSTAMGTLTSGMRLDVLESEPASGYVRVRTADGREGWVQQKYLQTEPVARDRVAVLEKQVSESRAQLKSLQEENAKLREELSRRPAASAGSPTAKVESLTLENEVLRKTLTEYESERKHMMEEYGAERAMQETLLLGAGILGTGVLVGLLLPWLRGGRRKGWSDL